MKLDLKDILIHAAVALCMTVLFLIISGQPFTSALAVTAIWYMYEVGQAVVKEEGGFLQNWNPLKWSMQKKLEFAVPALVSILVTIVYIII